LFQLVRVSKVLRDATRFQVQAIMSDVAIRVDNLVKVYRRSGVETRAVDDLSFAVRRGAIFGLLGPNGAGKTSTLRILTTLARPTAGRATVLGHDVVRAPLEVRRRIGVVIQEQAAELLLSVRDNLLTFARFHGRTGSGVSKRADEVMGRFGLDSIADRKVQDLSGGARRRVQVAKMFMVDVPVIFLDEFSTGMDAILKRAVMDLLRAHAAQGRTIVLTTQILTEAEELCDDILIVNNGRQVARGTLDALKMLTHHLYDVTLGFDRVPAELDAVVAPYRPIKMAVLHNTVRIKLKDDASRVLELVAALSKRGRVQRVEISGASLEDVFVELTQDRGPTS
jgi:ABC-2 type transport system ATP-binding protein